MPWLKPTFSLSIGNFSSTTGDPAGGPGGITVERDMDIPADALKLRLMERSGIVPGDDVRVQLGHDYEEKPVFTGKVAVLRPDIEGVEIYALGTMNGLLNTYMSESYQNQTPGSIARDLIRQAGLFSGTVDEGPALPRFALDIRTSAFAHLKELADRLGYELYADRDGSVMFHALGPASGLDGAAGGLGGASAGAAGSPALGGGEGYAYGQQLLHGMANRRDPPWSSVVVGGESPMSGQGDTTAHWLTVHPADYRGSAGRGAPGLLVNDPAARTKDLANRFAAGRLAVAARQAHEVRLTLPGRPQPDLGDSISSSGLPDELINASGYIRAIRHRFNETRGFITDFRISVAAG